MAVGQLAVAFTGSAGVALIMIGREKTFAKQLIVFATLNGVGNFVVIPIYGAFGAAVVTSISLALLAWGQLFTCRNLFNVGEGKSEETPSADSRDQQIPSDPTDELAI